MSELARVFRATPKSGATEELLRRFETSSAELVKSKQGIIGYRIYKSADDGSSREVIFESLWKDLNSIRQAFGPTWRESFLPEGYRELIDTCSVAHYEVRSF